MIPILEPLSRLPGVEVVMLISHDGVPIACLGKPADSSTGFTPAKQEALAALAASWLNELNQAVGPLSWNSPERVCLRAARGTLVLRRAEKAILVAWLTREASPEDIRLSMDGTLARIERSSLSRTSDARARDSSITKSPALPGPIPAAQLDTLPSEDGSQSPSEFAKRNHPPGN